MLTKPLAIACAFLLAALAYAVWKQDRTQKKLVETTVERDQARADLAAERENTRKANESDKRYQARSDELSAAVRDKPLPAVRVCRRAPVVPATGAAPVADEATQGNDAGEDAGDSDGRDIGPALDAFATDAEANLIQCRELMRWVENR